MPQHEAEQVIRTFLEVLASLTPKRRKVRAGR